MATATVELDMQGVPPNPLPIWRNLPLNCKIPMPAVVPKGAVELYTGHMGEEIWKRDDCLDFDLWDPNLHQLPAPQEYNALKDPYLRAYLSKDGMQKRLLLHGLVTQQNAVLCSLQDFNRYRRYLHNFNLNVVKTHERSAEAQHVKDMMFSSLGRVQKQRTDALNNKDNLSLHKIRYSSVLVTESGRIRKTTDPSFESSELMQTATEGERRSLNTCRNIIQEDFRKAALIRLRRLQDYDDRQLRGLNDWRKRRVAQVEWLAEEKLKGEQLERERLRHIQEHIQLSGCQRRNIDALIQQNAKKRYRDMREASLKMSRRICIKMHRQWPLSVRCPPNVLNEYQDEEASPCCSDAPAPSIEPAKAVVISPTNSNINAYMQTKQFQPISADRGKDEPPTETQAVAVKPSRSLTTTLTEHILQNAVSLLTKYSKSPAYGGKQIASMMESSSMSPGSSRRGSGAPNTAKTFVAHVANEVKQEMRSLVQESPDVLRLVANTLARTEREGPVDDSGHVDWDNAPAMKSSSTSLTGQYIRDSMLEVAGQMAEEGLVPAPIVKADVNDRIADAIMDLSLKTTSDDLQNNLVKGKEMVELAEKILRSHRAMESPGEVRGEEDLEDLSVCLITSLIRTALLKFKDAMLQGRLKDEDLIGLASSVDMDCFVQTVLQQSGARQKLLQARMEAGHELISDEEVEKLVMETVRKIVGAQADILNQETKSYISDAAKKFIEKVINNVFDDINPQSRMRAQRSPQKIKQRKRICFRPQNKSNNNTNFANESTNATDNNNLSTSEKFTSEEAAPRSDESSLDEEQGNDVRDAFKQRGDSPQVNTEEFLQKGRIARGRKFRNLELNSRGSEVFSSDGEMLLPGQRMSNSGSKQAHNSAKSRHPVKLADYKDQEGIRKVAAVSDSRTEEEDAEGQGSTAAKRDIKSRFTSTLASPPIS